MKVHEILQALWEMAPAQYRESWDNIGLLCGHADAEVRRVLVALDATPAVAAEAAERGCQLVLVHHPLIFGGLKAAVDTDPTGAKVLAFLERGLAVISMHTNLDCAPGGVNDVLAARLGLQQVEILQDGETAGLVRIGTVPTQTPAAFAAFVKSALGCSGLRYVDGGRTVSRVAVGGGACAEYLPQVLAAGCDAFVTGDVKYHQFCDAAQQGLSLIDAGHFQTENPVCERMLDFLRERLPALEALRSERHGDCIRFLQEFKSGFIEV